MAAGGAAGGGGQHLHRRGGPHVLRRGHRLGGGRNGIVNGVSETEFAPDRAITREEMAAILYRYAEYKGYDTTGRADLSAYTDEASISPYAVEAMQWANAEDVIQGVTTTTLVPQGSAIRAQVATMLMRFLESHAA